MAKSKLSLTAHFNKWCIRLYLQTPSAAPFIEDHLLPDTGTERREFDAYDVLVAFRNWAETTLSLTSDYDHAMMFTA